MDQKKKFTFPCVFSQKGEKKKKKKKKKKGRKFLSAPWWLLENLTERQKEEKGPISPRCSQCHLRKHRSKQGQDVSGL